MSFQSILILYYVTAFVKSLLFYQDSVKKLIKVSVKIAVKFSCKQNFIKFYTTCHRSRRHDLLLQLLRKDKRKSVK